MPSAGTPKRPSFCKQGIWCQIKESVESCQITYDRCIRCKDIDIYYHVSLAASNPVGCRALLLTFEQFLNEFLLDFSKIIRGS